MTSDERQQMATLAAAIVISRGAKDVAAIREAWTDAKFIIAPNATEGYRLWAEQHGITVEEKKHRLSCYRLLSLSGPPEQRGYRVAPPARDGGGVMTVYGPMGKG